MQPSDLSDRQQREVDYHKEHAKLVADKYANLSHDVVYSQRRRWWNAYWYTFTYLRKQNIVGKKALVIGCGGGEDAVRLALLGADVHAFDLSPDMLAIASGLATSSGVTVQFSRMPAEKLGYPDNFFDLVFARDIFHHVDIPAAVSELRRVGKVGSIVVVNEIYSHSITEVVRRSSLVEKVIYPQMVSRVYGGDKPYITEDERKLSEHDVRAIAAILKPTQRRYFNFIVTRLVSDNSRALNIADRILLMVLGPLGRFCAGRIVMIGDLVK